MVKSFKLQLKQLECNGVLSITFTCFLIRLVYKSFGTGAGETSRGISALPIVTKQ